MGARLDICLYLSYLNIKVRVRVGWGVIESGVGYGWDRPKKLEVSFI